jgi:hypothetical protein
MKDLVLQVVRQKIDRPNKLKALHAAIPTTCCFLTHGSPNAAVCRDIATVNTVGNSIVNFALIRGHTDPLDGSTILAWKLQAVFSIERCNAFSATFTVRV